MDCHDNEFEAVIGLEVHAQLMTATKIFCRCSTSVDAPANQNLCPVCAGHPGVLPVLNRKAVEFAVKAGLALQCEIRERSVFARKNYFYADLPKGYQISQFDKPLCEKGRLAIEVGGTPQRPELAQTKWVGIQRIHMEEDAGKSVHMTGYSMVNLNRACVPLIEIVSEPDMRSPDEAGAYLRKLHQILMYIGVNDGNLQEGSFRCDANVSIRPRGQKAFGTRTEIKNVNSFRFVEKAIAFEINRHINVVRSGQKVVQETRTYDSGKDVTISLRSKEEAHDYRYFPEPDLLQLVVLPDWVDSVRKSLPELPDEKRRRFIEVFGLPAYDAHVIVSSQNLAQFFEATTALCQEPKVVSNWVMGELLRLMKQTQGEKLDASEVDWQISVSPKALATLVDMVKSGKISHSVAKSVFEEVFLQGGDPAQIVADKGLSQVSDTGAIEKVIDEILAKNPDNLAQYRAGKEKLFGFFVGQTMKAMGGKANPQVINDVLKKKLQG